MSHVWPALEIGEQELTKDEVLWRQVTKFIWDEEKRVPASNAFGPSTADEGRPSFSQSGKVTAQESRDWHQQNARSPSLSVWSVSVFDVLKAKLRVIDDSAVPVRVGEGKKAPGHCYADFRNLTRAERKNAYAILLREALRRGEVKTVDNGLHHDVAA